MQVETLTPSSCPGPRASRMPARFGTNTTHIVDIAPTLLELIGLPAPTSVNGVGQMALSGVSMAYTFDDAEAPTRKSSQYYEMLGSRAIWSKGWTAVTWHEKGHGWEADKWELYNTDEDFSQANDLAAKRPEKLKELQALWFEEAKKNSVLPLDDRRYERVADPTRPIAALEKPSYEYYPIPIDLGYTQENRRPQIPGIHSEHRKEIGGIRKSTA